MVSIDFIGSIAGLLTTIAFVPQVIKTWRSGSAEDISLVMFLLFTTGVLLWLVYGVILNAMPIVLANSVTLVLALIILSLKIRCMLRQRAKKMGEAGI